MKRSSRIKKRTSRSRRSKSPPKRSCKQYLQSNIRKHQRAYNKGSYVSRAQALAIAYKETLTSRPGCVRSIARKKKTRHQSRQF